MGYCPNGKKTWCPYGNFAPLKRPLFMVFDHNDKYVYMKLLLVHAQTKSKKTKCSVNVSFVNESAIQGYFL